VKEEREFKRRELGPRQEDEYSIMINKRMLLVTVTDAASLALLMKSRRVSLEAAY
jgi:hypothetical protein